MCVRLAVDGDGGERLKGECSEPVASWISQQDLAEFSSTSFFANGNMTGSGAEVKEKRSRRQAMRSD